MSKKLKTKKCRYLAGPCQKEEPAEAKHCITCLLTVSDVYMKQLVSEELTERQIGYYTSQLKNAVSAIRQWASDNGFFTESGNEEAKTSFLV